MGDTHNLDVQLITEEDTAVLTVREREDFNLLFDAHPAVYNLGVRLYKQVAAQRRELEALRRVAHYATELLADLNDLGPVEPADFLYRGETKLKVALDHLPAPSPEGKAQR